MKVTIPVFEIESMPMLEDPNPTRNNALEDIPAV